MDLSTIDRLGPDLLDVDAAPSDKVVRHPVLEDAYALELQAWEAPRPRRIVLMCTRGLFVKDVAEELQARDYVPWCVEVERVDVAEFERTVRKVAPAFAVAINQTLGLPEALDAAGVPLITWEIDPAIDWLPLPERPVPHSHLFTFRRQLATQLAGSGHGSVTWLPLAAPDHRRPLAYTPEDHETYASDVSFVGSSLVGRARGYAQTVLRQIRMWLQATGQDEATAGSRLEAVLTHQRAQPDVWCLPEGLAAHCPGFRTWCQETGHPSDPILLLGELPAAEHRLQIVRSLAPLGIDVWGDPGWKSLQVPGLKVRGFAGHLHALTRIYGLSRINIDIGRLYQPDIVTMRVFDVLACGGFVLAAHSEELGALFEVGVEVESWSSRDELVDKVRHFLKHPDRAQEIAKRGRAAVLARHRVSQRVGRMLDIAGLQSPQSE
jgi:spore maturation protein CgeB